MARVEVVCVGTELLSGKVNTHVSWLAGRLKCVGLTIARETSARDEVSEIEEAVGSALSRSDLVVVCGGLGPTFDDLTREGTARALGAGLVYKPELYARIRAKYLRHYRRIPSENRRQAFLLEGAKALPNAHGSAPGQFLRLGEKTVVLLPGPPWELYPMFEGLLPLLRARHAARMRLCSETFRLCGLPESAADERLAPLVSRPRPGLSYTILAGQGRVDFHVTAQASTMAAARRRLGSARREVLRRVGRYVYGGEGDTLESVVGALLRRRGLTLAAAESCTAGLFSARVTAVPGSSDYFLGGVMAYADVVKKDSLDVRPRTLERHGAVSEECAREMAEGVRGRLGASCGVSITGIAGPGGGTPSKPVGLTYLAVARRGRPTAGERHVFSGTREMVRDRAAAAALTFLYKSLR